MSDGDFGDTSLEPVPDCPTTEKHWVEIHLEDEEDQPVANEEYHVTLPDGQEVRGYTDDTGKARFSLPTAGNCKIRFPNIDADAWREP